MKNCFAAASIGVSETGCFFAKCAVTSALTRASNSSGVRSYALLGGDFFLDDRPDDVFCGLTLVALSEDCLCGSSGAAGAFAGGDCGVGLLVLTGSGSEVSIIEEGCSGATGA